MAITRAFCGLSIGRVVRGTNKQPGQHYYPYLRYSRCVLSIFSLVRVGQGESMLILRVGGCIDLSRPLAPSHEQKNPKPNVYRFRKQLSSLPGMTYA